MADESVGGMDTWMPDDVIPFKPPSILIDGLYHPACQACEVQMQGWGYLTSPRDYQKHLRLQHYDSKYRCTWTDPEGNRCVRHDSELDHRPGHVTFAVWGLPQVWCTHKEIRLR